MISLLRGTAGGREGEREREGGKEGGRERSRFTVSSTPPPLKWVWRMWHVNEQVSQPFCEVG